MCLWLFWRRPFVAKPMPLAVPRMQLCQQRRTWCQQRRTWCQWGRQYTWWICPPTIVRQAHSWFHKHKREAKKLEKQRKCHLFFWKYLEIHFTKSIVSGYEEQLTRILNSDHVFGSPIHCVHQISDFKDPSMVLLTKGFSCNLVSLWHVFQPLCPGMMKNCHQHLFDQELDMVLHSFDVHTGPIHVQYMFLSTFHHIPVLNQIFSFPEVTFGARCLKFTVHHLIFCTGFANWRAGWSEGKKLWCCQHYSKGCQNLKV